jgi:hypothetical protein
MSAWMEIEVKAADNRKIVKPPLAPIYNAFVLPTTSDSMKVDRHVRKWWW